MGKEKRGKNIHSREAPFSKSTGGQERKTMTMGKRQNPEEAIPFQPTWLLPLWIAGDTNFFRLIPDLSSAVS